MEDKVSVGRWLVTLILLSIPGFNVVYIIILMCKHNELANFAKALLIYVICAGLLIIGGSYLVIKENPKLLKNSKMMLSDYIRDDDNEEKIITYEGKSPNSLTINQEDKESYYGNELTGYLKLTGVYNIYTIEASEGLAAGIKIAGENQTYTLYRYASNDLTAVETGLVTAYQEKGNEAVVEAGVQAQGSIAEVTQEIDKLHCKDGETGYLFSYMDNILYIVGNGSEDTEWGLQSYTLTPRLEEE